MIRSSLARPKSVLLLGATSVFLLFAAACSGGGDTIVQAGGASGGISVSGSGEVQTDPDIAVFSVGVEVREETVAEARDGAAEAAQDVINALRDNGVDERDIRTVNFSIQPQFDFRGNDPPRLLGYVVTNTVEVTVREIDDAGRLIDDAAEAGGDATRVQNIRFELEDPSELIEEARQLAVADARARAEQLADLGEVQLGKPLSIVESGGNGPAPVFRDEFAAGDTTTSIQPGTTSVRVTVNMTFAID